MAVISWFGNLQTNGPTDPLTIITSKTPFFFLSGDLGITIGTGVSAWADQSGNGNNAIQGTGGAQPTYTASDSLFNNKGSILGDGSNDNLTMTWNPPAPGTTNIWFFAVISQVTSTAGDFIWAGDGNNRLCLSQDGTNGLIERNVTAGTTNTALGLNAAARIEELFSNSASDYLKVGSSSVAGTNTGNTDPGSFILLARNGSANAANAKIACIGAWNGEPTSGEKSALDAWVTAYYGSGVAV